MRHLVSNLFTSFLLPFKRVFHIENKHLLINSNFYLSYCWVTGNKLFLSLNKKYFLSSPYILTQCFLFNPDSWFLSCLPQPFAFNFNQRLLFPVILHTFPFPMLQTFFQTTHPLFLLALLYLFPFSLLTIRLYVWISYATLHWTLWVLSALIPQCLSQNQCNPFVSPCCLISQKLTRADLFCRSLESWKTDRWTIVDNCHNTK